MNTFQPTKPRRQPLTRKRIAVALALLPATLPFALLHQLVEWWHSNVSQALVNRMRTIAKARDKFFDSFAPKAAAQHSNKETE